MTELQTYTGRVVNPIRMQPEMIDLVDVAHALSQLCRFTGHTREFYSVAQHSVIVSTYCEDEAWGLMHDASEAYLCDISRPVKSQMPIYQQIEKELQYVVAERFGLSPEIPQQVKDVDDRVMVTERRDLMAAAPLKWTPELEALRPYGFGIHPLPPRAARTLFLKRAHALGIK